jgi:hypothetical protein
MRRFLGSICGLLLLALSVAWGGHIVLKQARLAHWPSADATVVSFDPGVAPPDGEGYHWYANPKIHFRYKVAGVGYESQRLNPSPLNYQSQTRFEADTDGFKRGATIRCWYNPSQPGEAYVVNRGVTCDGVLIIVGGCLIGLLPFVHGRILWQSTATDRRHRSVPGNDNGQGPGVSAHQGPAGCDRPPNCQ